MKGMERCVEKWGKCGKTYGKKIGKLVGGFSNSLYMVVPHSQLSWFITPILLWLGVHHLENNDFMDFNRDFDGEIHIEVRRMVIWQ